MGKQWELTVLGYTEGDICIAHCLDFDLVAEGKNLTEARDNLVDLVKAHLDYAARNHVGANELLKKGAPKEYWKRYNGLKRKALEQQMESARLSKKDIKKSLSCAHG